MPKVSGIQAIEQLREAGITIPVIILTTFDDHKLVLEGMQAGAKLLASLLDEQKVNYDEFVFSL